MKGAWISAIAWLIIASGVYGCADETRYRILSFFLTVCRPRKAAAVQDAKRTGGAEADTTERRRYREHGPYAAKLCEGCHQRGAISLLCPWKNSVSTAMY